MGAPGGSMEGWASIKNAATYADVSVRTMRGLLKRGLKHSRLSSGMIRIRYSDIDEFFMQYQVSEDKIDRIVDEVIKDFERKNK
jgi:hypothetical protein